MARLIPPPPRNNQEFDHVWKDWLNLIWRRVKGLEPGESDGGDSNALHTNVDNEITTISNKASLADGDEFVIEDSAASYAKKAVLFSVIKSTLHTYFGGLYLKLDASNDPITNPLEIQGAITATGVIENINTTAKTANYTIVATDDNVLCDTSSSAFTITLPASPENGRVYAVILETGGNTLTISGNGKNINGSSTLALTTQGDAAQLVYNGTQWNIK